MKTKTLLLAAFMCLFSTCLFSQEEQLVCTDFEPDSTIFPVWFAGNPLDLNYDGLNDIVFKRESRLGYGILKSNRSDVMIAKLDPDIQAPLYYIGYWVYERDLLPYGDYCFGVKCEVGDDSYCYGWIRFRIDNTVDNDHIPSITVYDMAYCNIPDYPLKLGQKSLIDDVAEIDGVNSQYELYPNPVDDRLVLKFSDDFKCEYIMIYSIDGRMIKLQDADFENIDVSTLERGMYLIRIRTEEGKDFVEKIVVK
jgi:hypothetical protein